MKYVMLCLLAVVVVAQEPVDVNYDISYPPKASQARVAGTVKLEVKVDTAGSVIAIKVISGHPLLIPVSMENAKKWKFESAGEDRSLTLTYIFRLGDQHKVAYEKPHTLIVQAEN
jgi:TonB family protein